MSMETTPKGTSGWKQPLTTFVQTETNTFRRVVQRLTGSGTPPPVQTDYQQVTTTTTTTSTSTSTSTMGTSIGLRKTKSCKLHERRQYMRPKLEIIKPTISPCHFKPPPATSQSCSPLLSPSTIFSKLSIHQQVEQENKGATLTSSSDHHYYELNTQEEEKAIKERRFYLHPSPRGSKSPELLTLFPLSSPKSIKKPS